MAVSILLKKIQITNSDFKAKGNNRNEKSQEIKSLVTLSPKGIDRHKDGSLTLSSQKSNKNEHRKRKESTEIWGHH